MTLLVRQGQKSEILFNNIPYLEGIKTPGVLWTIFYGHALPGRFSFFLA